MCGLEFLLSVPHLKCNSCVFIDLYTLITYSVNLHPSRRRAFQEIELEDLAQLAPLLFESLPVPACTEPTHQSCAQAQICTSHTRTHATTRTHARTLSLPHGRALALSLTLSRSFSLPYTCTHTACSCTFTHSKTPRSAAPQRPHGGAQRCGESGRCQDAGPGQTRRLA